MKPAEIEGIKKDFEEPGHLAPTGLFLGGEKYMVVQGEGGAVIRGKKVSSFDITNKTLFIISELHVMIVFCRDLVELLSRRLIKPLSLASTTSQ